LGPSKEERNKEFYFGHFKFEMFENYPSGRTELAIVYWGLKSMREVGLGQEI
jgi:hypothetical protein